MQNAEGRMQKAKGKRRGFTLIEMIVVIGITLVLAALLVGAVASPILVQDKARRGVTQLQGMFRVARMRAVADGAPRGVRLILDPDGFVRQLEYIEQPSDFTIFVPQGAGIDPTPQLLGPGPGPNQVQLLAPTVGYDFTGGLDPTDPTTWPVQADKTVTLANGQTVIQPGDYLEVQGGGLLHRISQVTPTFLTLASTPPSLPATGTKQWRVIRQPRVLKGETPLLLPQDIAIDIVNSYPPPSGAGSSDILFAPSGRVLGSLFSQDRIILWVCDVTRDPTAVNPNFTRDGQTYATNRVYYKNNPMLLSIHARTGFIAVHPVDISNSPSSDFSFTRDGRSSGL